MQEIFIYLCGFIVNMTKYQYGATGDTSPSRAIRVNIPNSSFLIEIYTANTPVSLSSKIITSSSAPVWVLI